VVAALLASVAVVYAAKFTDDTFGVDSAGTNLTAHTSDDGKTWSNHVGGGNFLLTDAARIRTDSTGNTWYLSSGTPASAEYEVGGVIRRFSAVSDNYLGVSGRVASGTLVGYVGIYQTSNNRWELALYNTSYTVLCSNAASISTGVDYTVLLVITDALKSLYVDGALQCSSADNTVTATGKAGPWGISVGGAGTNSTGMHLDNFCAGAIGDCPGQPSAAVGTKKLLLLGIGPPE
jgi:hypothetical protein